MHYRKNFLTNVVLRLDFDAIAALRESVSIDVRPAFSARLAETFPVVSGKPTATLAVNVGPMGAAISQQMTGVVWDHRRVENGTQLIQLTPESMSIEYGKDDFDHFPLFRAHVQLAVDSLIAEYHPHHVNRLGLRYINQVTLPEGNPLDWAGILRPDLITAAKAGALQDTQIVRSMHQITVRRGDHTSVFNYGLINPDFPNALARRVFVLDYDCSQVGQIAVGDILASVDQANTICETMFENSVDAGLREIMEIIND